MRNTDLCTSRDYSHAHLKILYLEDDPLISKIVLDKLVAVSKNIYYAKNGASGLELYHSMQPNIIVTDIMMPHLNGLEFITKIREIDKTIPIIVTTAIADVNTLVRSIDLKVNKYILKPFSPDEIISSIHLFSRHILISELIDEQFALSALSEEQLKAFLVLFRNAFTGIVKEYIGKGAPKISIDVRDKKIEIILFDNFSHYEKSLQSIVYDSAYVNTVRKSLYETIKDKIERSLSFTMNLSIHLENMEINIDESYERFIFTVYQEKETQ